MNFTVNSVLQQEINKLDHIFLPADFKGNVYEISLMQNYLKAILDTIGIKSTKAQNLTTILTTTEKLRNSEDIVYLLNKREANHGQGKIIGLLKVGVRSLYFHDAASKVHHMNPLCILDFYILEEHQKEGYGIKLVEHMLADQCKTIHEIAVDNPSQKMENFLKKHYKVQFMRHNNNFSISPFLLENNIKKSLSPCVIRKATPKKFGRFAAKAPPCQVGTIIHGDDYQRPVDLRIKQVSQPSTSSSATETLRAGERPSSLTVSDHYSKPSTSSSATQTLTAGERPSSLTVSHHDSEPSTSSSATETLTAGERTSSLTVSHHDSKPASTNKGPSMPTGKRCTSTHNAHTKLW